ncbi:MAG TPA: SRPBCC domain-containing protein [Gaiellaceae bacterium]|nr:SRPBCC domain-containing protein [Gaiellaceae bacterium]
MTVVEIDLRVGGKWRYVMVTPDGMEVGFHGDYREIVPHERVVTTEVYEGIPQPADGPEQGTLNTLTLSEVDGRTRATILVEAPSREVRDAIIDSGMEDGLQDALALLDEVASSLR